MKEYIKNNIIVVSIIILIIFIILISIVISIYKNNNSDGNISEEIDESSFDIDIKEDISKVILNNEFYNVKNCVQYYIDYLNDENYDAIYKVLDENFIKDNDITVENLKNANIKLNGNKYIVNKMNKKDKDLDIIIYFVYGKVVNDDYTSEEEKNFTVIMDYSQDIFAIIPKNLEENSSYEYNFDIKDDTIDYYNEFINETPSEQDILTEYFNYYKDLAIHNPSEAFALLEEEYRNKRFDNEESKYIKYLKDINVDNIYPDKYMYNEYDDYAEYVCLDKNGIYYIFEETAPMEFTLKLDTYTIETEKFITEYDSADDEKKVMMNIDKWIMMLENKDYENAYNSLDETFRNNNFENLENFEEYIKNNIPNNNSLEFEEYNYVGDGIYTEKIKLTNNEENIEKTLIIQLQEDRKFVLSFDI
ncbi:MAG: hypothetical protein IJE05_01260 [Clostridia bacterium]|nr:hypothetical protein [Clostridia bacterium]